MRPLEEADGAVGNTILEGGADAVGVEVETPITPPPRWNMELLSTYEDG
jgi:hypothetical protein